jgi:hypothetical protein
MDTFTSDYISNIPTGMTSNVVRSIPRSVEIPIKLYKPTKKDKKHLREIQQILHKFVDILSKVN